MDDLDAALAGTTPAPETARSTATVRPCRRHEWVSETMAYFDHNGDPLPAHTYCIRCRRPMDPIASRRGRNNRKRGNAAELAWTRRMGMTRTGQYGGADDGLSTNGMFAGQSKSLATARFPGWMADELEKLRRAKPDRTPVLGILEAPGPGRTGRRLVVVAESDWVALHVGTEAA